MLLSFEWAKRWLPAVFLLLSLFLPWWIMVRKWIGFELYLSFPWGPNVVIGNESGWISSVSEIPYFSWVSALLVMGGLCGLSSKRRSRILGGLLGVTGAVSYFIFVFNKNCLSLISYLRNPYFGIAHRWYIARFVGGVYETWIWFLSVGFYLALAGSIMLLLPTSRNLVGRLRKQPQTSRMGSVLNIYKTD